MQSFNLCVFVVLDVTLKKKQRFFIVAHAPPPRFYKGERGRGQEVLQNVVIGGGGSVDLLF